MTPVSTPPSRIKYYTPALLWTGVIFVLISIPGNYIVPLQRLVVFEHFDKIVHIGIFGVLILACMYGSDKVYGATVFSWQTAAALFVAFFLGALSELMQAYILIGRDGSIWDFVADCLGSIGGVMVYGWWRLRYKKMN